MNWDALFGSTNLLAMLCWAGLIFLPRRPLVLSTILYLGTGLLCLLYAFGLVAILTGLVDPAGGSGGGNFSSIEGVRAIFASDGGVAIGWIHYLAFDLFVGLWIARDGDDKEISRFVQAPILLATFLAGPLGLFVWLIIRERRARMRPGWQS